MVKRVALLTAAGLTVVGCSHQTVVSHQTTPLTPRASRSASQSAMARQIENAVDAGEGDSAVRELRRRLTANPDDVKARLELVAKYEEQGVPELAIEHLRLAVNRSPHLSELQARLAKALHTQGSTAEAAEVLAKFCNWDHSPAAELLSLLGIYQDELGLYTEAETHHRAAVATAPLRDSLHNNLGYNLLLQGKPGEAVAEFRRAIALNPRSEIARNNLGTALALSPEADFKEAVLQWQSVSDPATAHSNLASVLIEQRRFAEAKAELEIALGYSRNHEAALSNLALIGEAGAPASVQLQPQRPDGWQRFKHGLRKALGGMDPSADGSGTLAETARKQ